MQTLSAVTYAVFRTVHSGVLGVTFQTALSPAVEDFGKELEFAKMVNHLMRDAMVLLWKLKNVILR